MPTQQKKVIARDCAHLQQIIAETIEKEGVKCNLNFIDVSNVFRMEALFKNSPFNGNISQWDVSNVTNMKEMFCGSLFNGNISQWDVSSVTNMSGMFRNSIFNGDISRWNVSKVTNMKEMFCGSCFDKDISCWNVSNLRYMQKMFYRSQFFGDVSQWDVSNVKNMDKVFFETPYNRDISAWNISEDCHKDDMFSPERLDFVSKYLRIDYFHSLKDVFQDEFQPYNYPGSRSSNRRGSFDLRCKYHDDVDDLLNLYRNIPSDGFIFSCVFLFHLMVHIVLIDERLCRDSFAYNKLVKFWAESSWPDLGIEVHKCFSRSKPEEEFRCHDLKNIISIFGLINKSGSIYDFTRECIFDRLYEILRDELQIIDMPQSAEKRVLKTVKTLSQKIVDTLSKFNDENIC